MLIPALPFLAAFSRVFREHRDTLGWFGYELMDPAAWTGWGTGGVLQAQHRKAARSMTVK